MPDQDLAAPASLNDEGKARWAVVAPQLAARGPVDREVLETYCHVWARWRQAEVGIAKTGQLVKKGSSVAASPLIALSRQAANQLRALEKRLGLDQAAPAADATPAMGIRAFARSIGVDDKAVRKAIGTGRIPASVVGRDRKGQPVISDPERARVAWAENAAKPKADSAGPMVEAQRTVAIERARALKLSNDLKAGGLMPLSDVKREAFESARIIREGLLNLPSRLAPELAAETDPQKVFARLDAEIRAALNAIADALEQAS